MPLHARFRASTSLLFLAALAFGVALAALGGGQTALANSTGTLIPTGQGYYSAWTPNTGSSEVDAIDDGTCGTGDGMWITGSYGTPSSSFLLNLSSMPSNARMQGIDVTICYSDSDGVSLPTVTPFIRRSNADFLGTGIDPTDTAGTVAVTRHWDLGGVEPISGLEIGVKHVGLVGQVKVWAMWAVITWNPPPTPVPPPTVSPSVITLPPGYPTFHLGQIVEWQTDVTVPPGNGYPLTFLQTWDAAVFGPGPLGTAMLLGSGLTFPCTTSNGFQCSFGLGGGTFRFDLRLVVQSPTACSSTSNIVVTLSYPPFQTLGEAHSTVSLNGGCPTPTPTATASSTSTSAPTATGTSPGSSATATGTSALSTSTPTGTTGSNTSTTTPGSATTTPTPTPTGTSSVPKPYHLRTMQLARDGTN